MDFNWSIVVIGKFVINLSRPTLLTMAFMRLIVAKNAFYSMA